MLVTLLAAVSWALPVGGDVTREFSFSAAAPFRAGWHRGADFAAAPGSVVRSACSGVVATARPGLVTLRCGEWRVTHLPVTAASVSVGDSVNAGARIGRAGSGARHRGLHVGVRREGAPFGYVDPLRFLRRAPDAAPPPLAPALRMRRTGPRPPAPPRAGQPRPLRGPAPAPALPPAAVPAPVSPPAAVPAPVSPPAAVPAPARVPPRAAPAPAPAAPAATPDPAARLRAPPPGRVRVSSPGGDGALAPWPAWVGLTVLLLGAAGGGVRVRVRRARTREAVAVASAR